MIRSIGDALIRRRALLYSFVSGDRRVLWSILPWSIVAQKRKPWDVVYDKQHGALNALNLVARLSSQRPIQKNLTPCESSCPNICAFPLFTSTLRAFCSRS